MKDVSGRISFDDYEGSEFEYNAESESSSKINKAPK